MVRKSLSVFACLLLLAAMCGTAQAATMTAYDGNMSSAVVNYFRDLAPKVGFADHYIAFRSGENEYTMLVGEVQFDGSVFVVASGADSYQIATTNYSGGYSYVYSVTADSIVVSTNSEIVYSDLGGYPELFGIGEKYEVLQTFGFLAVVCGALFMRVFRRR